MKRLVAGIFMIMVSIVAYTQAINIVNLHWIFKPGLQLEGEYFLPKETGAETAQSFGYTKVKATALIPVKGRVGLKLTNDKGLLQVPVIKKGVDIRAHQIFWRIGGGVSEYKGLATNNIPPEYALITTGITGIHYIKKFRFAFYNANLSISESYTSIELPPVRADLSGGIAKVFSPTFIYFYGLSLNYNDGLFLPIPFIGFTGKISKKVNATIVLPMQANISYKVSKGLKQTAFMELRGARNGYIHEQLIGVGPPTIRSNFGFYHLRYGTSSQLKLSKKFQLSASAAYTSNTKFNVAYYGEFLDDFSQTFDNSFVFEGKLNYTFGKSLLNNALGKSVINF